MIKKEGILKSLINIGNDKNKQSEAIKDYKERQSIVIKNLENKIRKKFDWSYQTFLYALRWQNCAQFS